MPAPGRMTSLPDARAILGVDALASPHDIRQAFRDAAKRAHPDRPGGDAAHFRRVLEAYRALQGEGLALAGPVAPIEAQLAITPAEALMGGHHETRLPDGRLIRILLPAGLRHGERLRAGETIFSIVIGSVSDTLVRGDDFWMTLKVAAHILADGGRVAIETPLGRRIVWITRKAGERRLIRLEGEGLPARAAHARGDLFLRLAADDVAIESEARQKLRRFAAAWAA